MSANEEKQLPIRVMIAWGYRIVCEGLAARLSEEEDIEATAVCEGLPVALERIIEAKPDVLVVDFHARRSEMLDLTLEVTSKTDQKVLGMGIGEAEYSSAALAAGATAFVVLRDDVAELLTMIRKLWRGEVVTPSQVDIQELFKWRWGITPLPSWITPEHLSILDLLAKGYKTKRIAAELELRPSGVDIRVRELLREFGVRNRPAAVAVARERRWI